MLFLGIIYKLKIWQVVVTLGDLENVILWFLFISTGLFKLMNGKSFTIHPMEADKPDECIFIQQKYLFN